MALGGNSLFSDWMSMGQGMSSGGGWSGGPLGAQGAAGGIAGAVGIAGIGLAALGMKDTMSAESSLASDTSAIAGLDQKINQQKKTLAHITTQRQEDENFRNLQKAQAVSKAVATNQGGGGGLQSSGYGGARSAEASKAAVNTLGFVQNQVVGDKIFDLTNQIDSYQAKIAQDQANLSKGQGMSQLGGGLLSGAMNIGMLLA